MDIKTSKRVLPILIRNKIVPFLWGSQGVGKTQTVKQIAVEQSIGFVHLHLATQEVGDLVGLLVHNKNGTVEHARPEWFPTEGKGILFLDELNRAHPDVLQAMFSLITEGTIHRHRLPVGWSIVGAGNYQTNQFQVTDTSDAAWMSRFCHIDFMPTPEEFTHYAEKNQHLTVADFIGARPEMLETPPAERFNFSTVQPDRRSWLDMVARLEMEDLSEGDQYELYSGIVGPTAAAQFLQHKKKASTRISGKQILGMYSVVRDRILDECKGNETRFDKLNQAVEEIFLIWGDREFGVTEYDNFKTFLLDIPCELALKVVNRMVDLPHPQKNEVLNDARFVEQFEAAKNFGTKKKRKSA